MILAKHAILAYVPVALIPARYGNCLLHPQLASEQGRVQVKKLEAKLYQASDPSDLQGRHARLKAKVGNSVV